MHPSDIARSALFVLAALLAGCPGQQECPDTAACVREDETPPAITSTAPADSAVDVAATSEVSLVFSEAMALDSVIPTLTRSGSLSAGDRIPLTAPQWSLGDTAVTFTPSSAMAFGTAYTVTVNGTDLAGNPLPETEFSFTVRAAPDTAAPTLVGTSPLADAMKVPVGSNLSFSFSEPLSRASVEGALSFSPPVNCTFSWFNSDSLLRCDPEQDLAWNTTYTATLSVGLTDASGNALSAPQTLTFTTEKEDQVAPVLLSSTPAEGALGAPRTPTITLTFNEAMNQVSVQAAFRITSPTSPAPTSYSFVWNSAGTEVSITPVGVVYPHAQLVQWELAGGAADLSENALASTAVRGFQVRRLGSVVLTGEAALDGHLSKWPANGGYSVVTNSFGMIGDNTANYSYRTFLSFTLVGAGKIPTDAFGITSANLGVNLMSSNGSPLGLGTPAVDHVQYGNALAADDWATAILGFRTYYLPASTATGYRNLDVTGAVVEDFQQRVARGDRSQFRIRTADTDNDGLNDWIQFGTAEQNGAGQGPQLTVQYEYP